MTYLLLVHSEKIWIILLVLLVLFYFFVVLFFCSSMCVNLGFLKILIGFTIVAFMLAMTLKKKIIYKNEKHSYVQIIRFFHVHLCWLFIVDNKHNTKKKKTLEKPRNFKKTRNIHKSSKTSISFATCIFAMWKETQSALIETKKLNTNANPKKLNIYGMSNIDNSNPYL